MLFVQLDAGFDYFNPRSLTGATVNTIIINISIAISIHAPSRERPQYGDTTLLPDYISIHAPSRERPLAEAMEKLRKAISIHAPSRERPLSSVHTLSNLKLFQSTLPHGSDRSMIESTMRTVIFQSTLPHGSDPGDFKGAPSFWRYFNPRSLTGATRKRQD